ncbi:hypothetical protein SCHPADRAFT_719802 [Schizopora paradoxa]|uniref:Uncharacterized protein n=1 Tax=Schizopora paradoxa TaxID=27342 RepID=A0A0H2RLA1_9AGAM|nr:hypothetical protein SCHPADRAFT_719802 [Schizopora paradoxa]
MQDSETHHGLRPGPTTGNNENSPIRRREDRAMRNPIVKSIFLNVLQTRAAESVPLVASDFTQENLEEAQYVLSSIMAHLLRASQASCTHCGHTDDHAAGWSRPSEMEKTLTDTLGQLSKLRQTLGTVEQERDALKRNFEKVSQRYEDYERDLTESQTRVSDLQMSILDSAAQSENRENYINDLEADLEATTKRLKGMKDRYEVEKRALQEAQRYIDSLEVSLKDRDDQVAMLNSNLQNVREDNKRKTAALDKTFKHKFDFTRRTGSSDWKSKFRDGIGREGKGRFGIDHFAGLTHASEATNLEPWASESSIHLKGSQNADENPASSLYEQSSDFCLNSPLTDDLFLSPAGASCNDHQGTFHSNHSESAPSKECTNTTRNSDSEAEIEYSRKPGRIADESVALFERHGHSRDRFCSSEDETTEASTVASQLEPHDGNDTDLSFQFDEETPLPSISPDEGDDATYASNDRDNSDVGFAPPPTNGDSSTTSRKTEISLDASPPSSPITPSLEQENGGINSVIARKVVVRSSISMDGRGRDNDLKLEDTGSDGHSSVALDVDMNSNLGVGLHGHGHPCFRSWADEMMEASNVTSQLRTRVPEDTLHSESIISDVNPQPFLAEWNADVSLPFDEELRPSSIAPEKDKDASIALGSDDLNNDNAVLCTPEQPDDGPDTSFPRTGVNRDTSPCPPLRKTQGTTSFGGCGRDKDTGDTVTELEAGSVCGTTEDDGSQTSKHVPDSNSCRWPFFLSFSIILIVIIGDYIFERFHPRDMIHVYVYDPEQDL